VPRSGFRLSKTEVLQPPPADEAAGEGEEALVDVVAAVGKDEEAASVV
jgi:hypothetical protein